MRRIGIFWEELREKWVTKYCVAIAAIILSWEYMPLLRNIWGQCVCSMLIVSLRVKRLFLSISLPVELVFRRVWIE